MGRAEAIAGLIRMLKTSCATYPLRVEPNPPPHTQPNFRDVTRDAPAPRAQKSPSATPRSSIGPRYTYTRGRGARPPRDVMRTPGGGGVPREWIPSRARAPVARSRRGTGEPGAAGLLLCFHGSFGWRSRSGGYFGAAHGHGSTRRSRAGQPACDDYVSFGGKLCKMPAGERVRPGWRSNEEE